jgi:hypothetical protein
MFTDTRQQNRDRWQWRIMTTAGRWLVTPGSRWQARVDTAHQVVYPPQAAI